ncbi:GNAT family N-acetyltransferase [Bordetella genomosp. 1]|uniref:GNAT family N-acetyltransferase n=1 Tax=Bordetella genomosp. 1 TaxID=1395607 RepID=A0ABX4EW08_9BORD|nr:GNAT family N-acetyltransferase [Bordetella genomosp. 1]OZI58623.1 GNAT family N-acetyltransferase [Bordetella genomosp. 1]
MPSLFTASADARIRFQVPAQTDLSYLLDLRRRTMDAHLEAQGIPHDDAAHMARILYHWEDARLLLIDGQPGGLLKAYRDTTGSETRWYVVQIQIAPGFQGQGWGERVLRVVLDQADAEGLPVVLDVLKVNPARRLYERCGFVVAGEGEHEYHMRRPGRVSV